MTSDPREIRRIWSVHSGYSRSPWYRGLRFDLSKDSIITAADNREHARLRNHVLPGYQGRELENRQEGLVDAQLAKFLALIEGKCISSASALRPVDMSTAMQYLTQDVISAIEFVRPIRLLGRRQGQVRYHRHLRQPDWPGYDPGAVPISGQVPWLAAHAAVAPSVIGSDGAWTSAGARRGTCKLAVR